MIAGKIQEEKESRLFELLAFNRDVKKIKALEDSMKKYGWISAYPMNVMANGCGKLKIKDGHHRFEVAQRLGIPFKYVVCNDESTVRELDKATNKWTLSDCLTSYCREGKIEYLKVKKYCDETGINLSSAISILAGNSASSKGNWLTRFRDGSYSINTKSKYADILKDLVLCLKDNGIKFYNNAYLVQALSRISFVDQFSASRLKSKIKSFAPFIEKKANLDQYLTLLEDIYNRQSRDKIPLKFLSDEKAKERAVA